MDDLIERANKYARGAGRIQTGQYRAATTNERLSTALSWSSAGLSAVVGTTIFAGLQKDPQWILPTGLAVVVAAALVAIERSSKLGERAVAHRTAGSEYGRLRRHADMLRLRLEGGDLTRAEGLAELDKIGDALSELAKTSRALPDGIYERAKTSFDKDHPKYSRTAPSHAGGIVVRVEDGAIFYLVVRAKHEPHEWVLPKGHIKAGESAEQAAQREVAEETGVRTAVLGIVDTVEFKAPNGPVKSKFFLMQPTDEGPSEEGRERKWVSFDEAMELLRYMEAQRLVCQAAVLLRKTPLLPDIE